jgi:hypothetical protein
MVMSSDARRTVWSVMVRSKVVARLLRGNTSAPAMQMSAVRSVEGEGPPKYRTTKVVCVRMQDPSGTASRASMHKTVVA